MTNTKKPTKKIDKKAAKRLLSYLKSHKLKFLLVIICIIISSIVTTVSAVFINILIDKYITPLLGQASPSFAPMINFMYFMATVYIIGVVSNYLFNRFMVTISQSILKEIRDEMFTHMQKLPIRYFDENTNGDIMSRYTNDTDALRQFLSQGLVQVVSAIITVVSVSITMILTSGILSLLMFSTTIITFLSLKVIVTKSSKYFVEQQQVIGELNGFVEEMISGQKVVKVFSHEQEAIKIFDEKNEKLRSCANSANTFANIMMPTIINLGALQYVLIAIVGGFLFINNVAGITIGSIGSFLILSRSFNAPLGQVSQQINSIIMALAGAKRIFEILDEEPEVDNGYVTLVNAKKEDGKIIETNEKTQMWAWKHPHEDGTITFEKLKGEIVLEDVDFGYTKEKLVLKNISINAKEGQKIALVGSTGAGKTTITNLINRFYDIADGKIRYDNININKIKKNDLRRSLGVVLQETNVFTDTVLENIRYGNLDATDEECIEASKKANAHHFVELLKDGYNTVIAGNGDGLSQGQRQLLSIARVIVQDPPVMILDEATSSIDTHTESMVQKAMDTLMKGRTVFVIAHRLSTIQNSNLILVLEKGEIIEGGTHNELIEKGGKYYSLYTGNFE